MISDNVINNYQLISKIFTQVNIARQWNNKQFTKFKFLNNVYYVKNKDAKGLTKEIRSMWRKFLYNNFNIIMWLIHSILSNSLFVFNL